MLLGIIDMVPMNLNFFSNRLVTFKRWAKNYIEKITVSL
jgi:hypothetical protein